MNFDVLRAKKSSLQLDAIYDAKQWPLNLVVRDDTTLGNSEYIIVLIEHSSIHPLFLTSKAAITSLNGNLFHAPLTKGRIKLLLLV